MKSVSTIALGAALVLVGATIAASPAVAQAQQSRDFSLTKEERAAILPLQLAVDAKNYAAAAAALPAAQSAAKSADARYFVAQYQLRTAIGANNREMQGKAIDALIASGGVPAADLPGLYANKAAMAAGDGEYKEAEAIYARLVEMDPNNAAAVAALGELRNDLGKIPEAVTLYDRSIALMEAAGQAVPEARYKRAVKLAYDARIAPASMKFSRALAAAYPTPANWRDAILIHRDVGAFDPGASLDLTRLMVASGALSGERDYLAAAEALSGADLPAGAKAVLDAGVARKMVDPTESAYRSALAASTRAAATSKAALPGLETKAMASATGALALSAGDAFYSHGDYAKAAALYRAAIQKGSVDANVANTRLGMALAMAGQKAEAQTAFGAVTGARAAIASLWMAWLARRA